MTALLKPGLVSLPPPVAHKKLETGMFSDVAKSNRRDYANYRCKFSWLRAWLTKYAFYDVAASRPRLKPSCSAAKGVGRYISSSQQL